VVMSSVWIGVILSIEAIFVPVPGKNELSYPARVRRLVCGR
jgi:hypothetical protein